MGIQMEGRHRVVPLGGHDDQDHVHGSALVGVGEGEGVGGRDGGDEGWNVRGPEGMDQGSHELGRPVVVVVDLPSHFERQEHSEHRKVTEMVGRNSLKWVFSW